MTWSLILTTVVEVASEEVEGAKKREERAAQKFRKSFEDENNGGVLAAELPSAEASDQRNSEETELAFARLWEAIEGWASKPLSDAIEFAKSHAPRSREMILSLAGIADKPRQLGIDDVASKFVESVWPSLKSRGWSSVSFSSGDAAGKTKYMFKENEVRDITFVLPICL
jgi:hypothetical protein